MKIRLLIFCLLVSVAAAAQPTNYTKINARYRWISGMFDSSFHLPGYNGTPSGYRVGSWTGSGALAADTANGLLYLQQAGAWKRLALYSEISSGGWGLTGNSGTTAGTNFIGTTDAVSFVVKTDNTERARVTSVGNVGIGTSSPAYPLDVAGKIGVNGAQVIYRPDQTSFTGSLFYGNGGTSLSHTSGSTGQYNTAMGIDALNAVTTGYFNTAFGSNALKGLTTGNSNTGVGVNSLFSTTTGTENTAVGLNSLYSNTTGDFNTGLGYNAGAGITTGSRNITIGSFALDSAGIQFDNVAIGYQSLQKGGAPGTIAIGSYSLKNNSGGNTAIAIGYESMFGSTSAGPSVAIGYQALYSNTTSLPNVAIGYQALKYDTLYGNNTAVGYKSQTISNAAWNTSVGYQSMLVNTTGEQNTAFGANTLLNNTTGIKNNAQGTGALESNTTGSWNTGIGHDCLLQNTSGNENVGIGWLGWSQNRTGSYNVGIGNSSGRSIMNGSYNTFIGASSGYIPGSQEDTVNYCVAIGYNAYTTGSYQFTVSDSIRSYRLPNIPSGAGTKALRYDPSTGLMTYADTTTGGGGGVTTMAAIGSSPNANGATISGSTLNLEPASASFGGVVTTGTQTFAGAKTFSSNVVMNGMTGGTYGGDQGFQVTNSKSLYFVTNGTLLNFEAGSAKLQVQIAGAGAYSQGSLVYGGNTGYWRMGSNMQLLGSAGYTSLGAAGTADHLVVASGGNVGIGTTSPSTYLDINGNKLRVRTAKTPSSASDTGNAGDICWDADYIYICTATNTWKRVAIATW